MKKKNTEDELLNQSIRIAELETLNRGLTEKSQFQNVTRHQPRSGSLNRSQSNLQTSKNFHSTTALKSQDHRPTTGRSYDSLHHQINVLQEEFAKVKKHNNLRIAELEDHLKSNGSPTSTTKLKTELDENIEFIKLKRFSKKQSAEILSLQSQLDIANSDIEQSRANTSIIHSLKDDLQMQLSNEKSEVVKLKADINSLKVNNKLLEEQLNDLQIEKSTLKEHNENLLNLSLRKEKIVDADSKNQFIKKIKELEDNLKRELFTKSEFVTKIAEAELSNMKLKTELTAYQSTISALQFELENAKMNLKGFQSSNLNTKMVDKCIMANLILDDNDKDQNGQGQCFNNTEIVDETDSDLKLNYLKTARELHQCKELLRVQYSINNKNKSEIEEIHKMYQQSGILPESHLNNFQNILHNYNQRLSKILHNFAGNKVISFIDYLKATQIKKLNTFQDFINTLDKFFTSQVECFEFVASNVNLNIPLYKKDSISQLEKSVQTEIHSVMIHHQNVIKDPEKETFQVNSEISHETIIVLFELHIEKANFTFFSDHLMKSSNNPEVFLTWNFLDDNEHQAYTPTVSVKEGIFDCSCQYEGPWSQFLCQYLKEHGIRIEIHLVQGDISVRLAETTILTKAALEHPNINLDFNSEFKNDNIEGHVTGKYLLKCDHNLLTVFDC